MLSCWHASPPMQAAGSRSRSMQQLNTRLDSALDYAGRGTQLRITRSELLLNALPTITSPGRSLQEPDARQSLAGSSRSGSLSAHRPQSVGEAATAPGTAAEAGPIGSPERWAPSPQLQAGWLWPGHSRAAPDGGLGSGPCSTWPNKLCSIPQC